jgi:hypothetical protein
MFTHLYADVPQESQLYCLMGRLSLQPCNPAVGGPAKSQLVHEVDALGGEIGKMADRTYLQKRILNRSKASRLAIALHSLSISAPAFSLHPQSRSCARSVNA